jgi:hypothetical protein
VQADEKSVLKIASRRKAARLVTDATELLDSQAVLDSSPKLSPEAQAEPSIACDSIVMDDPHEAS